jgi:hypothetical protein
MDEIGQFLEMPEGATGHAITLQFTDPSFRLGAVILGFDSNFYPICTLLDREAASKFSDKLKAYDHNWIDQRIERSKSTAAVMFWRLAHEPGVWYFHVPATRVSSSEVQFKTMEENGFFTKAADKVPSKIEPFLSVYIEQLDIAVRVAKEPFRNRMTWSFRLMKLEDCLDSIATIIHDPKECEGWQENSSKFSESSDDCEKWIQVQVRPNTESAWGDLAEIVCGYPSSKYSLDDATTWSDYEVLKRPELAYESLHARNSKRAPR